MNNINFDVIVVGAGHAGIEACLAANRLGVRVALITNNLNRIGFMSCNPSIGGLGKGHIVKEIDTLGGLMGIAADESCLQFKRLNARKGPAVRGSRMQCDKDIYSSFVTDYIKSSSVNLIDGEVEKLIIKNNCCCGVQLKDGSKISSRTVVIATGTFLNAVMHFGLKKVEGGRVGDKSSYGLSDQLRDFGFNVNRFKTGTPPRLKKSSINWSKLESQAGDEEFIPFSILSNKYPNLKQIECHISYTNKNTHEIILENLNLSPMYCGIIEGIGPRYCPSIEDKLVRFSHRDKHQTFLEPEGLNTDSIYLQGISTSLPEDVQIKFLKTMNGLENVELIRPGYAVEYDCIEPSQLYHRLESRLLEGLFLAGQVNGTSGYEEAAGQGLVAGTNAALKCLDRDQFLLGRDESYIGVMIDDLVYKGTREPYRMMTARAEFRLNLREDNVIERLHAKGVSYSLIPDNLKSLQVELLSKRSQLKSHIVNTQITPTEIIQSKLRELNTPVLLKSCKLSELLRRSEISCFNLREFGIEVDEDYNVWHPVEVELKYSGYLKRQLEMINQVRNLDNMKIPNNFNYIKVSGLSLEEVEKLIKFRPETLGDASRISGVNPSALQALAIYLKANSKSNSQKSETI